MGPRRGQAMVEFALAAPIVLLLLLGCIEGSLFLFVNISAHDAAAAAAAAESVRGNASDADAQAIAAIRATPLGTTSLAEVSEIDVARLVFDSNGHLVSDGGNVDVYRLDGTAVSTPWSPASRTVGSTYTDYLGITIHYRFSQGPSAIAALMGGPRTATYTVRLEPQTV